MTLSKGAHYAQIPCKTISGKSNDKVKRFGIGIGFRDYVSTQAHLSFGQIYAYKAYLGHITVAIGFYLVMGLY